MEELRARVDELERLAGALGDVPDGELADALAEAVRVLGEINAGIERRIEAAGEEFRVVVQSVAADQGLHFEVEEMPLPHVTKRDRNAPNARGRGVGPVASVPGDRMGSQS